MTIFYSSLKNGFYSDAIHQSSIPEDAVAIPDDYHAALLAGQTNGGRILANADGYPELLDNPPISLAELKLAKSAEINAARAAANTGVFMHAGKWFSCDVLSRGDIDGVNGYVALFHDFPPQFPGAWKAVDNTWLTIPDIQAWKSFYAAMIAAGSENFAHAQSLKERIGQATTIAAVEAVKW